MSLLRLLLVIGTQRAITDSQRILKGNDVKDLKANLLATIKKK